MSNILFLVPRDSIADAVVDRFRTEYPDIEFRSINSLAPQEEIQSICKEDFRIIIARGNTAEQIRHYTQNVHLIEFNISSYDILRLIKERNLQREKIAIITIRLDVTGIELVTDLLGIDILDFRFTARNLIEKTIRKARTQGASLIIGGTITYLTGKAMGVDICLIPISEESMHAAIYNARKVEDAIRVEEVRQHQLNTIMDSTKEGILAVDENKNITHINRVAEDMLARDRDELCGKPLAILPSLANLAFDDGASEEIARLNNLVCVVSKTDILYDNNFYGSVFTLYEKRNVERMDYKMKVAVYSNEHKARYCFADMAASTPGLKETIAKAKKYARTTSNILITGESGTGKEVIAQSIHNESRRKNKPFVAINCAAFPKDLLQSELFGYADGAFTGAQRGGKPGLIEIADGGTLFLDEIAEMDYATQANLLRVVQERYIIRLGSHHPIAINCCIISATNKNLVDMIGKGLFREDLYYRLNVLSLNIPPLREHKCDIISLIHFFLNSSPAKRGNREISLSEHAKSLLESYSWPGNIRELRNFTERLLAMCPSHHIRSKDIQNLLSQDYNIAKAEAETASYSNDVKNIRHEAQMKEIREALQESKGNYGEAAKRLGISRTTLWRRMRGRTS